MSQGISDSKGGSATPYLSVVVPVLNEQDSLRPLYEQIAQALQQIGPYEVIFVDDGSMDGSFEILKELYALDPKVHIIRFSRNFGQTAALSAGFAHARGQIVVALDADLQNDPADIPSLVRRLQEGFDVVSGWRRDRKDRFLTRRLPSMAANWLISTITGVKLHDYGCTLKAYHRDVLEHLRLYGEMHRFIPAIASWSGARITEVVVNHRPRLAGKAKYGLARTLKVLLDLITVKFLGAYSTKPIYVFGGLGSLSLLACFVCLLIVAWQKLKAAEDVTGNPLFVLAGFLAIGAIQFILMGLLAELLVRTYHESQGRPTYVITEILQHKEGTADGQTKA